jgi:hypothetical protein
MELSDTQMKILIAYCRGGVGGEGGGDAARNDAAMPVELFSTLARVVASSRSAMTIDEYARFVDPVSNLSATDIRRLFDTHVTLADLICKSWFKGRRERIRERGSKHQALCLTPPSMQSDMHG